MMTRRRPWERPIMGLPQGGPIVRAAMNHTRRRQRVSSIGSCMRRSKRATAWRVTSEWSINKPMKNITHIHRISAAYLAFLLAVLVSALPEQAAWAQKAKVSFTTCLKCHPDVEKELAQKGAHEPFKTLQCSSCHNPHATKHEKLLKEEIGKLCKDCHRGQEGLMAKKYRHEPYEAGECLACHRPHASSNPRLLAAKDEQLCFGCHAEEGGFSKKNKHDPVKKGRCLSCHSPHTSDHEDLVKKDRKRLCVSCHSIKDSKGQKAHLSYPMEGTDCMSCHSPHGSDRSRLVKDSLHRPFAQKKCVTCHNGLEAKNPLGLKAKGAATCFSCHPSTGEDFKKINSHVDAVSYTHLRAHET